MITLYTPNETDVTTLGLGALNVTSATIQEQRAGLYELEATVLIDDTQKWRQIATGCLLRVPAPTRETPAINIGTTTGETVTREVYTVNTSGSNLNLRTLPDTMGGKIKKKLPNGTKVIKYGVHPTLTNWWAVIVKEGGAKGYVYSSYLSNRETVTETIKGDSAGTVVEPRQTREQLFRVYSVTYNTDHSITVKAKHLSYDLADAAIVGEYSVENKSAQEVCAELLTKADHDAGINIYCECTNNISADYTDKNLLEALLDDEIGVATLCGARVIRDNEDIYILKQKDRPTNAEIRRGKNLISANLERNASNIYTRIIPVGRDAEGKPLYLDGDVKWVALEDEADYPHPVTQIKKYSEAKVSDEMSASQARAKLRELAEADLADMGVESVHLDADFVRLELLKQYAAMANQYALHIYDDIRVIDTECGIDVKAQLSGYTWDCIQERYTAAEIGEISEVASTVAGWQISSGAVTGSKLARASVGSEALQNLAVQTANINNAAITTAKIKDASITTLKVKDANITTAKIKDAAITNAKIADLGVGYAKIGYTDIGTGVVENLITANEVADKVYINRLQLSEMQAVTAQINNLIIKASDGYYYKVKLSFDTDGNPQTTYERVTPTAAEISAGKVGQASIVETAMTVTDLSTTNLKAINALIGKLTASQIDTGTLFARQAVIDNIVSKAAYHQNLLLKTYSAESVAVSSDPKLLKKYKCSDDLYPSVGDTVTITVTGVSGVGTNGTLYVTGYNGTDICQLTRLGSGAHRGVGAYKKNGSNGIALRVSGVSSGTVKWEKIKMEFGDVAYTDYTYTKHRSEADESGAVYGSAVTIADDGVDISTPKININVSGTNGDLTIDESGVTADVISSPSIMPVWTGPSTLYITPAANGSEDQYGTLKELCAELSNHYFMSDITVYMRYVTSGNTVTITDSAAPVLKGCHGANITISGRSSDNTAQSKHQLASSYSGANITISNCTSFVTLSYINFNNSNTSYIIEVNNSPNVRVINCNLYGNTISGTSGGGISANASGVRVGSTGLYRCYRGLYASFARAFMTGCSGGCTQAVYAANGSQVGLLSSTPTGTLSKDNASVITSASSVTPSGGSDAAPTTGGSTYTLAKSAQACFNNDQGINSGATGVLQIGQNSTTKDASGKYISFVSHYTAFKFTKPSGLPSGAPSSASLTIKRSAGGANKATTIYAGYGTVTSSGITMQTDSYVALGKISQGETKTFTSSALAALIPKIMANTSAGCLILANKNSYIGDGQSASAPYNDVYAVLDGNSVALTATY